jgi:hypothetical protein
MEQLILHACGHEQVHHLTGFTGQQDRKATWLRTTKCRTCFRAEKQSEQAAVTTRDEAAIAHLDLQPLVGSDRQVAWARAIRASRLAALLHEPLEDGHRSWETCLAVTDAKWWIDHRALTHPEFHVLAA